MVSFYTRTAKLLVTRFNASFTSIFFMILGRRYGVSVFHFAISENCNSQQLILRSEHKRFLLRSGELRHNREHAELRENDSTNNLFPRHEHVRQLKVNATRR